MRTMMEIETSVKPITQPARNAVLNALPSDYLAYNVVLKFEYVATFIPNAPQNIEVIAPIKKVAVVEKLLASSTQ